MTHLHPRPNFSRNDWIDLCGKWSFAYDDNDVGLDEGWQRPDARFDREITVPFPPESDLSGIGDKSFHPIVWYQLAREKPEISGQRLILNFGAVDYRADVFVNGELVATHHGGHTPFSADITVAAARSNNLTITVRAEDDPASSIQARGKQDWQEEAHAIWYHRTTGIWQPVWLEVVPQLYVTSVHCTPDLHSGRVDVELTLNRAPVAQGVCDLELYLGDDRLVHLSGSIAADRTTASITVPGMEHGEARSHLIWSPDRPNLIDVTVTVKEAGQLSDMCHTYFGMRSCGTDHGRFTLNDKPVFMRSVLEQGFWPQSHLAAPDGAAIRREVELIKALGFNAVRLHQKVEDPRFLYWCDRLGLMAWGEMPSAYAYSPEMVSRFTREWMEVVERDRSHPCIVTWVPLNESWGVPDIAKRVEQRAFASALYHLTKSIDPTRPVISNDGWEQMETDIIGVHDYSVKGDQLALRYASPQSTEEAVEGFGPQRRRIGLAPVDHEVPVMITEFGGVSYLPKAGQAWFGYGTVTSEAEYLAVLEGLFNALHASPVLAGYCYTQLTDTLQEKNGLLDENRQPKLPIETVRTMVMQPSEAIPAEYLDMARAHALRRAASTETSD